MSQITQEPVLTRMREDLTRTVKKIVEDAVVDDLLKDFESRVRPKVRELLAEVTIDKLTTMRELYDTKERLEVSFRVNDDGPLSGDALRRRLHPEYSDG